MQAIPTPGETPTPAPSAMQYGVIHAAPLAVLQEEERKAAAAQTQEQPVVQGLAGYIRACWAAARDAKRDKVEPRMLANLRARRGEYDPQVLSEIRQMGGSEIFAMITSVKCRAAGAWIRDVMLQQGSDRPWTVRPTRVPELPPEVMDGVIQEAAMPIAQLLMSGINPPQQQVNMLMMQAHDSAMAAIREQALMKSERMADKMEDQLVEGGWLKALDQFIDDLTTFPSAILKGPVVRKVPKLKWVETSPGVWEPQVTEDTKLQWERVSPFDIYPSPTATCVDDGYLIERHRLSRSDLLALKGVEGYDDASIDKVLEDYGKGGLKMWLEGDTERAEAEGQTTSMTYNNPDSLIDALQFWGSVSGDMLLEWGLTEQEVPDKTKEYQVECWLIGNYVIKAMLNPDPMHRKPYFKTSYEEIPGSWWGNSVADLISDVQRVANAAARQLVNNMGLASGPQVVVNINRLADGEEITQLRPWRIWQTTDDAFGAPTPQSPIEFYTPESRINELMAVFEKFSQLADEYSGIPRYLTGDTTGGAGRTASGLSMLINNAGKSIKQVVSNIDTNVLTPLLDRLYYYNMRYLDDPDLKGDVCIVARGASSLVAKEAAMVRRMEFLAATNNPVDIQITGLEGRAHVLREVAKALDMNTDKIVPAPEMLRVRLMQAAVQQAQMAQQQPQQIENPTKDRDATPNPPNAGQAGPSSNGQALMDESPVTDNFQPVAA